VVNGLAWPNMNVDQGQYLFKILDGSNARWYDLSMSNGMPFTVIASDENYLKSAVTTTSFTVAPGERYDVLVDFSGYAPGTEIVLKNKASAPYAYGKAVDLDTGVIMKFTVGDQEGFAPQMLPAILNPTLVEEPDPSTAIVQRTFTLKDFSGESGDLMSMLDGQLYKAPISEYPKAGTTEIWRIIDATRDSHQIHIGLVNFRLVSRQMIDIGNYGQDWMATNGGYMPFTGPTKNIDIEQYLIGDPIGPAPIESGWKDSIDIDPGEVVTIMVRFSPVDGRPYYSFDPTEGPAYIWYSHILDHEENEMARQFKIVDWGRDQV
jgi:spore coat protein A